MFQVARHLSLPYERHWAGADTGDNIPPDERQVLNHLKTTAVSWVDPIQQAVKLAIDNEELLVGVQEILGGVIVGGENLRNMATKFDNYVGMMKEIAIMVETIIEKDQLKVVLEDTVNILALIGVMCTESITLFKKDNAQATWKELLKHAEQIHKEVTSSFHKNERVYKQIYEIICNHLPANLTFMINVAASVATLAWPNRVAIAKWIASNWKTVGYFALALGVVGAVGAALYMANKKKKEKDAQLSQNKQ